MLTISKPLSARQVHTYHAEEFSNAQLNYYTTGDRIHGQWHGELARRWGLSGDVTDEHVHRLADGQHPVTGERLVEHQTTREYTDGRGERVTPMTHRAAWDATFSAPKSVSLTALVGPDPRVAAAHRDSVRVALDETSDTSRPASAAIIPPRPPGTGSPPPSSMTVRGPSMATPRRSSTRTPSSSMSPSGRTGRPAHFSRESSISRSST
jgi:hypothetical protein